VLASKPGVARLAILGALVILVSPSSAAEVAAQPDRGRLAIRNGDILFVSLRARNGQERLYLMRSDGTDQRPLTRAPSNVDDPTWSPDGRIAFRTAETVKSGCTRLFVMQANGARVQRLTHDNGCYSEPAWSPDGRRLVFEREGAGGPSIWTMNVNGTRLHRLTRGALDTSPAWSPDGKTIAFARYTGSGAIWLMDADGTNKRQLTTPRGEGDDQPDWSPDGAWIAFSRETESSRHDIFVVRSDGTGLRRLTRHARGNYMPAWSPNGRRIVFASGRLHPGLLDIYVMNADGKRQTRLTKGTIDNRSPDWRARP